jgi:hypothetical protein
VGKHPRRRDRAAQHRRGVLITTAWKDLELRICRALGGQRAGPTGKGCSDCTPNVPFAVEIKRSLRRVPEGRWIEQARRNGKTEGRDWLLVVAGHRDTRPVVVLDFWTFAQVAQQAGLIPTPLLVEHAAREPAE